MNRAPLAVAIPLLVLPTTVFGGPKLEIVDVTCFDNGTLVGHTLDLGLVVLKEGHWQPLAVEQSLLPLWRSPDGRVFDITLGGDPWSVVELTRDSGAGTHWKVPTSVGAMRFTSLNGVDVVTPNRIYRLDPGGGLTDLGETPLGGSGRRSSTRAPEILVTKGMTVVCTGTSEHPDDNVGGSCQDRNGTYVYRVDFGEPLCCGSGVAHFTAPFVCGDAVISALRNEMHHPGPETTQARALTTGELLGRRPGAARLGSTCLDGRRALLVGKRDIQIVSVPGLRRLWRERTPTDVQAIAVCGGTKAAVILKGNPLPFAKFDLTASATLEHGDAP